MSSTDRPHSSEVHALTLKSSLQKNILQYLLGLIYIANQFKVYHPLTADHYLKYLGSHGFYSCGLSLIRALESLSFWLCVAQ